MHTDLVLPTQNEFIDWTTKVSSDDTKGKKRGDWLAFGWGDKGFYSLMIRNANEYDFS